MQNYNSLRYPQTGKYIRRIRFSCHLLSFLACLACSGENNWHFPSKHAGSDSEVSWSRPVMAIQASVKPDSGRRIVHVGSDFPHHIRFRSSREGPDHTEQNRPGSDVDGLVTVLANVSGPEASRCARVMGPNTLRASLCGTFL